MTLRPCSHENEIKALLDLGAWPHGCPPELRAHVQTCDSCKDLVLVTVAFKKARTDAGAKATAGSAGAIWWRAQLRRRNAAVELIGKPILGAQIFALSMNLVLALGLVVSQARHGVAWLTWLERLTQARTLHLEMLWPAALFDSSWSLYLLISALGTLALVGGLVVYLGSEKR